MEDSEILKIGSQKAKVVDIIYKGDIWAIVAMYYNDWPCLGIRWFGAESFPTSYGKPSWFVLPQELYPGILNSLPIRTAKRNFVMEFLNDVEIFKPATI